MSRFYVSLPAPQMPANAMLNFDPLNRAVSGYKDAQAENAMFSYKQQRDRAADARQAEATAYGRGRDAISDARYADELQYNRGRQGTMDQRATEQHGWSRDEQQQQKRQRALTSMAGIAQTIMDSPPEQQAARYQQFRAAIPDFDADMQAAGFDPNNWQATLPAIVARARGYQNPLEQRKTEAEIGKLEAQAAKPPPVSEFEKARQKAVGKAQGEAIVALPATEQVGQRIVGQIDDVLSSPRLPNVTGWQSWFPTLNPSNRDVEARIAQLGGAAFLQAFETLKGGGQITEAEGRKATEALARLTDLSQSDSGYRQALEDFKAEVTQIVSMARARAGQPAQAGPTQAEDPLGIR